MEFQRLNPITGELASTAKAMDAGDIDDLAAPARDHMACNRLTDMENAGDIGLQELLESVGGEVL